MSTPRLKDGSLQKKKKKKIPSQDKVPSVTCGCRWVSGRPSRGGAAPRSPTPAAVGGGVQGGKPAPRSRRWVQQGQDTQRSPERAPGAGAGLPRSLPLGSASVRCGSLAGRCPSPPALGAGAWVGPPGVGREKMKSGRRRATEGRRGRGAGLGPPVPAVGLPGGRPHRSHRTAPACGTHSLFGSREK